MQISVSEKLSVLIDKKDSNKGEKRREFTGAVAGAVLSLFSAVSVIEGTDLIALSRSITSGGGGSGLWCRWELRTGFLLFISTIEGWFGSQLFKNLMQ